MRLVREAHPYTIRMAGDPDKEGRETFWDMLTFGISVQLRVSTWVTLSGKFVFLLFYFYFGSSLLEFSCPPLHPRLVPSEIAKRRTRTSRPT